MESGQDSQGLHQHEGGTVEGDQLWNHQHGGSRAEDTQWGERESVMNENYNMSHFEMFQHVGISSEGKSYTGNLF